MMFLHKLEVLIFLAVVTTVKGAPDIEKRSTDRSYLSEIEDYGMPEQRSSYDRHVRLWNPWRIPYVFASDHRFTRDNLGDLREAFHIINDKTCINFEEYDSRDDVPAQDYIEVRSGSGCNSHVGIGYPEHFRENKPATTITLTGACFWEFGILLHEIGHALGIIHEQQRSDRDDYIRVNMDNVIPRYRSQYTIRRNSVNDVPYDYSSIMHYSHSYTGEEEMIALDEKYQHSMGQRLKLSFSDLRTINNLYCEDACPNSRQYCAYGGYPDPSDCRGCICPDGFGGSECQDIEESHAACDGGVFNLPDNSSTGVIASPINSAPGQKCNWLFIAPCDRKIRVQFFGVTIDCFGDVCSNYVELNGGNWAQAGPRYCDCNADLHDSDHLSDGNEMMITYRNEYGHHVDNAFAAFITVE